jgi:hypothetical protein
MFKNILVYSEVYTMTLDYKLEYFKGVGGGATDEGVFIQLRTDVPAYTHIIAKEDYFNLPSSSQNAFMTGLFGIAGVVRASSQAHRLYYEKSPVFTWEEMNPTVLAYLAAQIGVGDPNELPGSPITLEGTNNRRSL